MSFTEYLNKAGENVRELFEQFDSKVTSIVSSKPYTTEKPDYRIKHPIHGHVFCDVRPMFRSPSLRVRIRVDGEVIPEPNHSMRIADIVPQPTGKKWIQLDLVSGRDLSHALLIIEQISKI